MTSVHALELANTIVQNDPGTVGPLITLLYAFRSSRGDPLGEAMTQDVLRHLFTRVEEIDDAIEAYVSKSLAA